jgi:dephospho-CoA kinase
MIKVGLTGSIGTGKSTVAKIFEKLGAYVIDADKVVHQLFENEDVKEEIVSTFGKSILDNQGKIDKKKLAQIIFTDKEKKKKLENILHPKVRQKIQEFIEDVYKKDKNAVVVAEIPLLIETGMYKNYDKVLVVYAPKDLQLKRLLEKGFSEDEAKRRINSQMDIEEKLKYADIIIENTSSLKELEEKVKDIYEILKKEAAEK